MNETPNDTPAAAPDADSTLPAKPTGVLALTTLALALLALVLALASLALPYLPQVQAYLPARPAPAITTPVTPHLSPAAEARFLELTNEITALKAQVNQQLAKEAAEQPQAQQLAELSNAVAALQAAQSAAAAASTVQAHDNLSRKHTNELLGLVLLYQLQSQLGQGQAFQQTLSALTARLALEPQALNALQAASGGLGRTADFVRELQAIAAPLAQAANQNAAQNAALANTQNFMQRIWLQLQQLVTIIDTRKTSTANDSQHNPLQSLITAVSAEDQAATKAAWQKLQQESPQAINAELQALHQRISAWQAAALVLRELIEQRLVKLQPEAPATGPTGGQP